MRHTPWRGLSLTLLATLALFFTACGGTTTVSTGPATTPITTGGGAGPTAPPVPSCATLLPGATPASPTAPFIDIVLPSGAVATAPTPVISGTGLYTVTLQNFCVAGTTTSAITDFFPTKLTPLGWEGRGLAPLDGNYAHPCSPNCLVHDLAPREISIEKVIGAAGGFVTFTLRFMVPPPEPTCDATAFPTSYKLTFSSAPWDFQLPPLTKEGMADSAAGHTLVSECSAGDNASILHAMQFSLEQSGYKVSTVDAKTILGKFTNSSGSSTTATVQVGIDATHPQQWSITTTRLYP